MNNKPVAWIGETLMGRQYINGQKCALPVGTPLYTHPVKKPMMVLDGNRVYSAFKELTDEEIKQIWYDLYPLSSSSYWDDKREGLAELKFAKAILRKAQEK